MKMSIKLWAGLGGLASGVLTTFIEVLSFAFAGLVFAVLLAPVIWIWKRRFGQDTSSPWIGLGAFLLICLATPWVCLLLYAAVDRLMGPYRLSSIVVTPLVTPGPSLTFVAGMVLAFGGWTISLAASLKFITGKWDRRFVFQLLVAGVGVLSLAFGLDYISLSRHQVFDHTLYLCGQSVSGFLLGASLERQTPSIREVVSAPATTL
jgi:hypothetical protein